MGSEDIITYQRMAEFVAGQTKPIIERAAEHDAWHRGQLEAQLRLAGRAKAALITQLVSVASLVTAAAAIVIHR